MLRSVRSGAPELRGTARDHGPGLPGLSDASSAISAIAAAPAPLELSIAPKRIFCGLLAVIAVLILAATLGMIAWVGFGRNSIWGLRKLFALGSENNIPTYFSSLQLVIAAVLLGVIARHEALIRSPWRWHFLVLAIGFGYLSVDEAASVHETLLGRLGSLLPGDLFYFAWLGPALIIIVLVGLSYLRLLLALPRRFGALFVGSGVLFLGGAVGVEWISGELARQRPIDATWGQQIEVIVEEALEMVGIALFIYALLAYIEEARISLVARVKS